MKAQINDDEFEMLITFYNHDYYTKCLDALNGVAYDDNIENITEKYIQHWFYYQDYNQKMKIIKTLRENNKEK